jgi:hypothetical protein
MGQKQVNEEGARSHTRKNSPRVELYGLQGLPLTYFYHRHLVLALQAKQGRATYQVLGEPEAQARQHAPQVVVRVSDAAPVSACTHLARL